jgi:predicted membrane protein (TIGR00267 family)
MERLKSRYSIIGLSDGLFIGLGLSVGVSFFSSYNFTLAATLLGGLTSALSNFFSTYNAETFATAERLQEYKHLLFLKEYQPKKLIKERNARSINYSFITFGFTLIGSVFVLIPYILASIYEVNSLQTAAVASFILSLIGLGVMGGYNSESSGKALRGALKTIGTGILISALSAAVGILLTTFLI